MKRYYRITFKVFACGWLSIRGYNEIGIHRRCNSPALMNTHTLLTLASYLNVEQNSEIPDVAGFTQRM